MYILILYHYVLSKHYCFSLKYVIISTKFPHLIYKKFFRLFLKFFPTIQRHQQYYHVYSSSQWLIYSETGSLDRLSPSPFHLFPISVPSGSPCCSPSPFHLFPHLRPSGSPCCSLYLFTCPGSPSPWQPLLFSLTLSPVPASPSLWQPLLFSVSIHLFPHLRPSGSPCCSLYVQSVSVSPPLFTCFVFFRFHRHISEIIRRLYPLTYFVCIRFTHIFLFTGWVIFHHQLLLYPGSCK